MKKFELTSEKEEWLGHTFSRIRACKDFVCGDGTMVHVGDFGGFVEKEQNLSQDGNAWIFDNAKVYGNAEVYDDADVYGDALIFDNALIFGNAEVYGNAKVYCDAKVYGNVKVCDKSNIRAN